MKNFPTKPTKNFLAKWLANEAPVELLDLFKKSDDYKFYHSLVKGVNKLRIVPYSYLEAKKEFTDKAISLRLKKIRL